MNQIDKIPQCLPDKKSESRTMQILDWLYEKALNGIPGMPSARQLAEEYRRKHPTLEKACDELIYWQALKCTAAGFLTGLGGLATLPIAISADLASTMYTQMRMIIAIAHMGGYDIKDSRVKTLVFTCLAGNKALDMLKEIGVRIGKELTYAAMLKISDDVLLKINQKVGFEFITKSGSKGIVKLGKIVPVVSGVISGSVDFASTKAIGSIAKSVFIQNRCPKV